MGLIRACRRARGSLIVWPPSRVNDFLVLIMVYVVLRTQLARAANGQTGKRSSCLSLANGWRRDVVDWKFGGKSELDMT